MIIRVADILVFTFPPKACSLLASCSRALQIEHEPNKQSLFEKKSSNELHETEFGETGFTLIKTLLHAGLRPNLGFGIFLQLFRNLINKNAPKDFTNISI